MRRGENPLEVCARIEKMADKINEHYLPPGVKLVTYYDRTGLTERTLHTVGHNMAAGIGLVLLVLIPFLGLGNWRSALVVALAVPVLAAGRFHVAGPARHSRQPDFDGRDRFWHHRRFRGGGDRKPPAHPGAAARAGSAPCRRRSSKPASEMGRPILFSKVILLTAFIPLYTMQRVEGRIFSRMALTLTFALIAGTLFRHCRRPRAGQLRGPQQNRRARVLDRPVARAASTGRRSTFALRAPRRCLSVAAAMLVAGGVTYRWLGSEFLPKLDEGDLWVRTFAPQSISPSESAKITQHVRTALASFPEVRYVVSQLGRPDDGTDVNGWDVTEYSVGLKPREQWTTAHNRDACATRCNENLTEIPGIDTQFSQYIEDNVNEAVSGVKSELAIKLFGDDPEQAAKPWPIRSSTSSEPCRARRMSAPTFCWASRRFRSLSIATPSPVTAWPLRTCKPSSPPPSAARLRRRCWRASAPLTWS